MKAQLNMKNLEKTLNIIDKLIEAGDLHEASLRVKSLVIATEIHNEGLEYTYNQAVKG